MKAAEVRDMTVLELENKLVDLKKELFALRFQHTVTQLDTPARLKAVKKDIARVKTILNEKSKAQ